MVPPFTQIFKTRTQELSFLLHLPNSPYSSLKIHPQYISLCTPCSHLCLSLHYLVSVLIWIIMRTLNYLASFWIWLRSYSKRQNVAPLWGLVHCCLCLEELTTVIQISAQMSFHQLKSFPATHLNYHLHPVSILLYVFFWLLFTVCIDLIHIFEIWYSFYYSINPINWVLPTIFPV